MADRAACKRPRTLFLFALGAAIACGGTGASDKDGGKDGGGGAAGHGHDGQAPDDGTCSLCLDATAPDTGSATLYDGTTGKACTIDSDCKSAHGPQLARCSNSVFAPNDLYATAVCILPTCSPVSGTSVHYCDGPDDPTSPGICVPQTSTGSGVCLPRCTYDTKGDPPVGCRGNDLCFALTTTTTGGVGYCWGGCQTNADCQDGQQCEPDVGLCVVSPVTPSKSFGSACTPTDSAMGTCNCLYGDTTMGYCTTVCSVGSKLQCPMGSTCDPLEFRVLGYTEPNLGMGGYCTLTCADGGACPTGATCTDAVAGGPDCIPP
jgi:hypothetical protein